TDPNLGHARRAVRYARAHCAGPPTPPPHRRPGRSHIRTAARSRHRQSCSGRPPAGLGRGRRSCGTTASGGELHASDLTAERREHLPTNAIVLDVLVVAAICVLIDEVTRNREVP